MMSLTFARRMGFIGVAACLALAPAFAAELKPDAAIKKALHTVVSASALVEITSHDIA